MNFPPKGKANVRFYDYLKGLQEEFELRSNDKSSMECSRPSVFHIFLRNLQSEFDLMTLEVEFLRRKGDEYETRSMYSVLLSW
jgi:hypothetical protein